MPELIQIGLVSVAATALVLVVLTRKGKAEVMSSPLFLGARSKEIVFLFDGPVLADATPQARALLPDQPPNTSDLERFCHVFAQSFRGMEDALNRSAGVARLNASGGPTLSGTQMDISRNGTITRIELTTPSSPSLTEDEEAEPALAAINSELAILRSISESLPCVVWILDHDGQVRWANTAYMRLAERMHDAQRLSGWPPPHIFEKSKPTITGILPETGKTRIALDVPGGDTPVWFDAMAIARNGETLYFATPIDDLVKAESSLREFIQTLTKTFAQLTIGLAIFDRKRRLAMFNPALIDLCGLPPPLLSGRPSLHAFLDALRERQRIPEPKDYRAWREKIAQLESAADGPGYEEAWHLPHGQILRVTGRPHPDGAVAFLFEDISSEIYMTRSFRAALDTGQAVLDRSDDALVVFSRSGAIVLSNKAYTKLWQSDPETDLTDQGIINATRLWQSRCNPTPIWGDLREFVLDLRDRHDWESDIEMADGRRLNCEVVPLPNGETLVRFAALRYPAAIGA
ncbi:PAS-domain containing protein [Qingshengfaniella alkalisoli]|uniref:PAS-domain containing protein n=1 Tax=Qingshengfaniella alkalisoli TaxID=2599296 RepID=UPI00143D08E0|nr:PAS-domain containing protein [Qingshengfaniella alkalisoli]